MTLQDEQKINADLLRPLRSTSVWFFLLIAFLGTIILCGAAAWFYQMSNGLADSGTPFSFFLGFFIYNLPFLCAFFPAGSLVSREFPPSISTCRRPQSP